MAKKIIISFIILLIPSLIWSEWIDISPGKNYNRIEVPEIMDSGEIKSWSRDRNEFGISIEIPGFISDKQNLGDVTYDNISIPQWPNLNEPGKPAVPIKKIIREIPENCEVDVEIIKIDELSIDNINILPAQKPLIDSDSDSKLKVEIDQTVYRSSSLFPKSIILSKDIVKMRNKTFLVLIVAPFRVNPAKKTLVVARKINLKLTIKEMLSQSITLLPDPFPDSLEKNTLKKYMILMDDQFEDNNQLAEFINWKRKKGYIVTVAKTSDINSNGAPTSSETEAYMRGLSNEEYPDYLLIIGDTDQTNGVRGRRFSTKFGSYTDLYIACRDTNDWIPDLAYGRLPASDNKELNIMLSKVITMDRNPPVSNMYDNVLVAAQIQAEFGPSFASRYFCETADYVSCYFEQNAGNINYDCVRAFVNPDKVTADCLWNSGFMWKGATTEQRRIGERVFNTFISDIEATNRIVSTINNGTSLVLHRDHGTTSGWSNPPFSYSDVSTLTNGNNLPVVFSINCLSGSFYRPTDFARKLINYEDGGASAVIGAVDVSYSGYNDWLTHGLFVAFLEDYRSWHNKSLYPDWPADLPAPPIPLAEGKSKKLGDMLNFAKFYMYSHYGSDGSDTTFELFHLVGDPESDIRLHNPVNINVLHEDVIKTGDNQLNVYTGDDTTTVCLYSEEIGIQLVQKPENGMATFNFSTNKPGTIYVTVTGYNIRPYEGVIIVEPESGLYISSPMPSSKLLQGKNQEITWQTFQNIPNVDLAYSTDNGVTFQNIATSIANTGSYNWVLPDVPTDNLIIQVSSNDGLKKAVSDSISLRRACSISGMVNSNKDVEITYKGPYSGTIVANGSGSYTIENLYPGEYTIYARENLNTTEIQTIAVNSDIKDVDFVFKHVGFKYQILSDWQDGFTANVTITNNTDNQINNWKLGWTFSGNQTINSMWNGEYEQQGQSVFVSNEWNNVIPANGGTVQLGLSCSYTGKNEIPTDFTILSSEPKIIKDIAPGGLSSNPRRLILSGNNLYFVGDTENFGTELWKSYGLEENTVMVKDISTGPKDSNINFMTDVNGKLYFVVDSSQLWVTDGTEGGTFLIKDNFIGLGDLVNMDGTLHFTAYDLVNGRELWKSDGTNAGTVLVKDRVEGYMVYHISNLVPMNGTIYYIVYDNINEKTLWRSDGTNEGTSTVSSVVNQDSKHIIDGSLTVVGDTLYFTLYCFESGIELWKTDGTKDGTVIVKDIVPSIPNQRPGSSYPQNLTNINGTLYFTADDNIHGRELWKTDGTEDGTVMVKDILEALPSSTPQNLIDINGMLYFTADNGIHGRELWKSDGTNKGTFMVKDLTTGTSGSILGGMTSVNNKLFFTFDDGLHGKELWQSDGSESGTMIVKDIRAGIEGSNVSNLTGVNNILYFTADDGIFGNELHYMLVGF